MKLLRPFPLTGSDIVSSSYALKHGYPPEFFLPLIPSGEFEGAIYVVLRFAGGRCLCSTAEFFATGMLSWWRCSITEPMLSKHAGFRSKPDAVRVVRSWGSIDQRHRNIYTFLTVLGACRPVHRGSTPAPVPHFPTASRDGQCSAVTMQLLSAVYGTAREPPLTRSPFTCIHIRQCIRSLCAVHYK